MITTKLNDGAMKKGRRAISGRKGYAKRFVARLRRRAGRILARTATKTINREDS
jgi:hypothetical protein